MANLGGFEPYSRCCAGHANTVNSCEEECVATQFVLLDFCANE